MYLFNDKKVEWVSEMNEIPDNILFSGEMILLEKIENYYIIYDCINHDNRKKILKLNSEKEYYILSMRQQNMSDKFIYLFESGEKVEEFLYNGKIDYFEKELLEYSNGYKEWFFDKIEDDINMMDKIAELERNDWFYMEKVDYEDENYEFYWEIIVTKIN
jgi:hypothetical protein